jgi:hypothetical protein
MSVKCQKATLYMVLPRIVFRVFSLTMILAREVFKQGRLTCLCAALVGGGNN